MSDKKKFKIDGPGGYGYTKQRPKRKRRDTVDLRDPDLTPVNLHTFDLLLEQLTVLSRDRKLAAIVLVGIPKTGKPLGGARVIDSEEGLPTLLRRVDEVTDLLMEGDSLGDEFSFVFED